MDEWKIDKRNRLTFFIILGLVAVIFFYYFFQVKSSSDSLFFSPSGSGISFQPTASGSGSGSGSGQETCCLCEYQTASGLLAGMFGSGPTINLSKAEQDSFLKACITFLKRPTCTTKILQAFDCSSQKDCFVPDSCKGKPFEYMLSGHSDEQCARPFIERTSKICIDCPNVKGISTGCSTFGSPEEAQRYINSLKLPPGVTLSIWGSQCITTNKVPIFGGYCGTDSTLGCTINYKCEIKYDNCPSKNAPCFIEATSPNIKCMKDGVLTDMMCCGKNYMKDGVVYTMGEWDYGFCSIGSGSIRDDMNAVSGFFKNIFA